MICLIEAIFCYFSVIESPYVGAGMFTCYFHLYEVTKATYWDRSYETIIMREVWFNEILFTLFQIASLFSNLCLCHDLVCTLQSPFNSAASRMTKYILFTFLGPIIVTSSIFSVAYYNQIIVHGEKNFQKPTAYIQMQKYNCA